MGNFRQLFSVGPDPEASRVKNESGRIMGEIARNRGVIFNAELQMEALEDEIKALRAEKAKCDEMLAAPEYQTRLAQIRRLKNEVSNLNATLATLKSEADHAQHLRSLLMSFCASKGL